MKKSTLISSFLLVTLTVLSGCSSSCHCPTCPTATATPNTTTIIHERPTSDY